MSGWHHFISKMPADPSEPLYAEYRCCVCGDHALPDDAIRPTVDARCICRRCYARMVCEPPGLTGMTHRIHGEIDDAVDRAERNLYTATEGTDDFATYGYRRPLPPGWEEMLD